MQDIEALVQAAQEGNLSAFGQVYEEYYLRVYRYAAARVGQGAEAEDVAQEVFLKALKSLNKFKFNGPPFAAWLFRIAHNLIIDRARHFKAASAATSGPPASIDDALSVAGNENVERQALQALDIEALSDALNKVTRLQRQVVELRFLAGLSLAETASVMGRKENAIKALQHSALGALRRLLAPQASTEVT